MNTTSTKAETHLQPSFPGYSLKERDRRWVLARKLMDDEGLDGLLVTGQANRGAPNVAPDAYLSNDRTGGWLILPREGHPILLSWSGLHLLLQAVESKRGLTPWIGPDHHWLGTNAAMVKKAFEQTGLLSARVGIIGLEPAGPRQESFISYSAWESVSAQLPNVSFVHVWRRFARMMLVKGDEEIEVVKQCANAGEEMSRAFVAAAKPGVTEADVYAQTMAAAFIGGANSAAFIIQSGHDNPAWGFPDWLVRPVRSRTLEKGDLVQSELFPTYGMLETQQQVCVSLGKMHPIHQSAAQVAREAYEIGLEKLRVGNTFGEVDDAMTGVVQRAGGWFCTPQIHSLNPISSLSGLSSFGMENYSGASSYTPIPPKAARGQEIVLQAGMTFAMEANCHFGDRRINIGGTVLLTNSGPVELNEIANHVVEL
jgi:Xaa-Pro aminopeptidase